MKRIVIISSSLRPESLSESLALSFAAGARAAGHDVEFVSLKGKTLSFCRGCLACQRTKECVIKDDAPLITAQVLESDVVVFTSPVYYYSISGALATLLDRMNSLFAANYRFREVYLLLASAEEGDEAARGAETALRGWTACFSEASFVRTIHVGGLAEDKSGDVLTNALREAQSAGENV